MLTKKKKHVVANVEGDFYMVLLFVVQTLIIIGNDIYFDESVNRVSVGDMSEKMLSYYNEISILKSCSNYINLATWELDSKKIIK